MRKAFLLLAAVSGFALAVTKSGGNGSDRIEGTRKSGKLSGGGGDDRIFGKGGNDRLFAEGGDNDFINAIDEQDDPVIDCGPGLQDARRTWTAESLAITMW